MAERKKGRMIQHGSEGKAELKRVWRVLFVDDEREDFELALSELGNAGLEVSADLVSTKDEFLYRLRSGRYDIIIADYQLKAWTAMEALAFIQESRLDIPLLLLSGTLGDVVAVDCIKRGVWDYILKDRLERLPLAVCRAVEEKAVREDRRRTEAEQRKSEVRFRTLADAISAAIFMYQGRNCCYVNRAAELITGFGREELLAKTFLDLVHPDSRTALIEKGFPWFPGSRPVRHEIKILRKDDAVKWLDVTLGLIELEGQVTNLLTAVDITERKQMEEEIRSMMLSDPLTGLGNYRRLVEVMSVETERSQRTGRSFALVLFDLDGLKIINDTHGHLVGSRALCRVADIMRLSCRAIDTAARYGGDEFALLLPETEAEGARYIAERIKQRVAEDGEQPPISVSFGIAVYPGDSETIEGVFRRADADLYAMKPGFSDPEPNDQRSS
jgi:diguanylate cyclase (GGDEF)-like protein/PAS domain S-box-containing protein